MASNVTRDHHSLTRNLKLNSKYISNDGGDEGITIDNAGDVAFHTVGGSTPTHIFGDASYTLNAYGETTDAEGVRACFLAY